MEICIITNHRNSMIFADNLIQANKQLGNHTYIFELDYDKTVQEERHRLLEILEQKKVDITLFLNDFQFSDNSFFIDESIANKVDCRLWIWDAVHDMKALGEHIYLYSKIYSFEINDVVQLKQYYSIDAQYLPLYAGQEFYNVPRRIDDIQDIDIFFIGTIAGSKKRLHILETAAKLAYEQGYKMLVLGRIWHSHHWWQQIIGKFKFKRKYPYLSKVVENKVVLPHDVIQYYKHSKINLNIHIDGHTCYNCRTFEIMGNDNFLLSDIQNKCNLKLQEGYNFDSYKDNDELIDKIRYYLEHDSERNRIAQVGGKLIREEYNLIQELKDVLAK